MESDKTKKIASLLEETGHAHHQAFIDADGFDPEWALWYANHLQKPLSGLLNKSFTKSKIVYELVRMDETLDTTGEPWPMVYARDLVSRYNTDN